MSRYEDGDFYDEYPSPLPYNYSGDSRTPLQVQGAEGMIRITNPSAEVGKIENSLRNQAKVNGKIVQLGTPLLNEQGINAVMGLVYSFVNRTGTMTHLDDKHVVMLLEYDTLTLVKNLMINCHYWEVKEPVNATRDLIVSQIVSIGFLCLRRPVKGGERSFWKGSQSEHTIRQAEMRRPGMLSRLNPFNRGG